MSDKPKKGNGLKIVIIVLLVLVVVGGAAFGGMYLAGKKGASTTPKVVVVNEITYSLDEFLLNLMDGDTKRYLKVSIYIGYEDNKNLTAELDTKKPIIRDVVIATLREKNTADFNTTAGVNIIKNQLIARINPTLTKGKITHIYFYALLVQ